MTKIKKIDYPDKEVYIGEVDKDGIPHGNGKYIFPNVLFHHALRATRSRAVV